MALESNLSRMSPVPHTGRQAFEPGPQTGGQVILKAGPLTATGASPAGSGTRFWSFDMTNFPCRLHAISWDIRTATGTNLTFRAGMVDGGMGALTGAADNHLVRTTLGAVGTPDIDVNTHGYLTRSGGLAGFRLALPSDSNVASIFPYLGADGTDTHLMLTLIGAGSVITDATFLIYVTPLGHVNEDSADD